LKYIGGFVDAQTAEESQLDNLRSPRIDLLQALECVVQRAKRSGAACIV
jgi:hypothetical protein